MENLYEINRYRKGIKKELPLNNKLSSNFVEIFKKNLLII